MDTVTPELSVHELMQIHTTHLIYAVRDIMFCRHCGYWRQLKTTKLKDPCSGLPKGKAQKGNLVRLLKGL